MHSLNSAVQGVISYIAGKARDAKTDSDQRWVDGVRDVFKHDPFDSLSAFDHEGGFHGSLSQGQGGGVGAPCAPSSSSEEGAQPLVRLPEAAEAAADSSPQSAAAAAPAMKALLPPSVIRPAGGHHRARLGGILQRAVKGLQTAKQIG